MTSIRDELKAVNLRLDALSEGVSQHSKRLDGVEHRLEGVEHRLEGVEHRLEGVEHRLEGVECQGRSLVAEMAELRAQMATKAELVEFREENRREHLELFATLREEIYLLHARQRDELRAEFRAEFASHFGALREWLASQLSLFVEAMDRRYVLREELAR